jgi:hypothetical protein
MSQAIYPSTKRIAKETGSRYYLTGEPCKNGHTQPRITASGHCIECQSISQHKSYAKIRDQDQAADTQRSTLQSRHWRRSNPRLSWRHSAVKAAKARSIKKAVPFDLDRPYLLSIATDECPILKTALVYGSEGRGSKPNSATVDRIIPSLGYVRGNIQVISARANSIKQNATAAELLAVAKWVADLEARL